MTRRAQLRASDAEREQVAERLRRASVEGRLGADELDDRLGAALSARTYGELDPLVADLPAAEIARSRRPLPAVARRRAHPVALAAAVVFVLISVLSELGAHAHAAGHGMMAGSGAAGALVWLVALALGWRMYARRRPGSR